MRRLWFILLALSIGLNVGLIAVQLSGGADDVRPRIADRSSYKDRDWSGPRAHPEGPRGFIRERLDKVGDRLDLSDEQIDAMAEILELVMPELVERREAIRDIRLRMREEYLRPQVAAAKIHELRRQTLAMQSELDSIMVETMIKEADILTPEQRESYFELMPFGGKESHGRKVRKGRRSP